MSWYFLGGFSACAIVPSARWVNHSGCSLTQGWSGDGLQRQVERHLEPELAGLADERVEVGQGPELGVDGVVTAVR